MTLLEKLESAAEGSRELDGLPEEELANLANDLAWIAGFAALRAQDDSRVFARVNRGALRTISERATAIRVALLRTLEARALTQEENK